MKEYKIPKIEVYTFPPNDWVMENQTIAIMGLIVGGCLPNANYTYKKNNNKIMLFLDDILMSAKFKGIKFVEKLCETTSHEIAHSHVWQNYHRHFYDEEKFAKNFARRAKDPLPFGKDHEMKCMQCGKETWWKTCPVCSIKELL